MKRALIGASGFAAEVRAYIRRLMLGVEDIPMFVDEEYWTGNIPNVFKMSQFNPGEYEVLIALGSSQFRSDISKRMPVGTKYFSFFDTTAHILDYNIEVGEGSIICPGCVLTTNIRLGNHAQLNLNTTIGHNCRIGEFFTTAPAVNVSGDCVIGDRVYIGTNASIRQKIVIGNDVTVGMGAVVVKDLMVPGTYVGNPARRLE